jgi:hypothetical protein
MRIQSSGNVDIGTTGPGEPLDVNGIIRSSSEIISTLGGGSYGGLRLIGGNYGVFFRNDGCGGLSTDTLTASANITLSVSIRRRPRRVERQAATA